MGVTLKSTHSVKYVLKIVKSILMMDASVFLTELLFIKREKNDNTAISRVIYTTLKIIYNDN